MSTHLTAIGLEKSYRGKKVVDGVSVDFATGEIIGLLGPNGAGKTTTFSMIIGLVPLDGGRITLGDEDITEMPMYQRAQRGMCLLPQEPSAFRKLSVEDNLLAILQVQPDGGAQADGEVEAVMREFGLERLAKSRAFMLSGGERRRLEIARAMLTRPEFVPPGRAVHGHRSHRHPGPAADHPRPEGPGARASSSPTTASARR